VDLDHPKALDFLREDCKHVNDYFRKKGSSGSSDNNCTYEQKWLGGGVEKYQLGVARGILFLGVAW
jgi:serine/threonine-protein kinase RIO1